MVTFNKPDVTVPVKYMDNEVVGEANVHPDGTADIVLYDTPNGRAVKNLLTEPSLMFFSVVPYPAVPHDPRDPFWAPEENSGDYFPGKDQQVMPNTPKPRPVSHDPGPQTTVTSYVCPQTSRRAHAFSNGVCIYCGGTQAYAEFSPTRLDEIEARLGNIEHWINEMSLTRQRAEMDYMRK